MPFVGHRQVSRPRACVEASSGQAARSKILETFGYRVEANDRFLDEQRSGMAKPFDAHLQGLRSKYQPRFSLY